MYTFGGLPMNRKLLLAVIPFMLLTACNSANSIPAPKDSDFDGLIDEIDPTPEDNTIKYSIKGDIGAGDIETQKNTFKMDYRYFVDKKSSEYSTDLAQLGCMLSSDIYPQEKAIIENAKYPTEDVKDEATIYKNIGAENVEIVDLKDKTFTKDQDDTVKYAFATHEFTYKSAFYTVVFVTIQGTNGTHEWNSNFDIGAESTPYTEITGEHPEWAVKKDHKGFNIAANRVLNDFYEYTRKYVDPDSKGIVFISGHSRGAAVANILGKMISDIDPDEGGREFVYTFASPTTTTDSDKVAKYTNIFNIVNNADLVSSIPLKDWGFTRYGVTKAFDVETQGFKEAWSTNHASKTYEKADVAKVETAFKTLSPTREGVYAYQTHDVSDVTDIAVINETLDNLETSFPGFKKYCKIEKYENQVVTFKYSPIMVTTIITGMMNGASMFAAMGLLAIAPDYASVLLGVSDAIGGNSVIDGHLPSTYFVICNYIK